ncbi:O-antigen ligase family protein [Terriglobus roseus]|uniref:O-antigen ligase n=1 Tax=Terriglobus roseus TaxID=392734 RepID=A0A1H4J0Y0_9BACT|nr:O-antigen ligase family protein [Terriglobus roseus]SEB39222.1 O-antigen ligase [Terriglobus roseus]
MKDFVRSAAMSTVVNRAESHRVTGPVRMTRGMSARWDARLGVLAGFIYSVSIWKFIKRDPLSGSLGLEAVLETGSVALAFAVALIMSWRGHRRVPPQPAMAYLAAFGVLTLASAFRSFSPSLSVTKTALFFAVLAMASWMAQINLTWSFLRGIYAGYISLSLLGLAVALAFPSRYPLILSEEWTHRNRLTLFDMHPNSVAETSALMFLLGRLLGGRYRWISQAFLLTINILAGEKTATAALLFLAVAGYLMERRWSVKSVTLAAIGLSWIVVGAVLAASDVVDLIPARYVTVAASQIYGDKVSHEVSTLDGRDLVWKKTLELASDGVLVGYGFEGAREELLKAVYWSGQAHNGLLEIVLDGGVLGGLFFTFGYVRVAFISLHGSRVWIVRVGVLHCMIVILSAIGPIFTFYSFFADAVIVSLAYDALKHRGWVLASAGRPALLAQHVSDAVHALPS